MIPMATPKLHHRLVFKPRPLSHRLMIVGALCARKTADDLDDLTISHLS